MRETDAAESMGHAAGRSRIKKPAATLLIDPKPEGEGPPAGVWLAAREGEAQAVAAWLDEGGAVDARCAEYKGATLLMSAAALGQEAIVRMLLQRGASIDLQDSNGITALMSAAINGQTTTVQALLDAKADASLQTTIGVTALTFAEHHKHTAIAQLLRQQLKLQAVEAGTETATTMAHAAAGAKAVLLKPTNLQETLQAPPSALVS